MLALLILKKIVTYRRHSNLEKPIEGQTLVEAQDTGVEGGWDRILVLVLVSTTKGSGHVLNRNLYIIGILTKTFFRKALLTKTSLAPLFSPMD